MKKTGILNSEISKVLADMGHTDTLTVGDCGLPVPEGVKKIDLALKFGVPSFLDVIREIEKDMEVEKVIVAKEMKESNPEMLMELFEIFPEAEFIECSHEELKEETEFTKAVVRTGECTPFSNCILCSGVVF